MIAPLPGKPDNLLRFDETEPGGEFFSIPGRARRFNRGRLSQDATGASREGAANRTIRKPEDVANRVQGACGQGFAVAFHECRREALNRGKDFAVKGLPAGLASMADLYGVDGLLPVAA